MSDQQLSMDELKALCLEYDHEKGEYPENEYEGKALYKFICNTLGHPWNHVDDEWKDAGLKGISDG